MRHGGVQLVGVKLAFPAADHDGGDAVADQVGQRAAFAHELVDAEQDRQRLDRMRMMPKKTRAALSMALAISSPALPISEMAKPDNIETRSTCSRSPRASAPKNESGMIAMRCATKLSSLARVK